MRKANLTKRSFPSRFQYKSMAAIRQVAFVKSVCLTTCPIRFTMGSFHGRGFVVEGGLRRESGKEIFAIRYDPIVYAGCSPLGNAWPTPRRSGGDGLENRSIEKIYRKRGEIDCLVKAACCTHSPQRTCKYRVACFVRATSDCSRGPFQAVVSGRLRHIRNR